MPSTTGVRPFPDLSGTGTPTTGSTAGSTAGNTDASSTNGASSEPSTSTSTSSTASSSKSASTSGAAGGQAAARQVAGAWIDALNVHDTAAVQAQVCTKTVPRFTEAFVTSIVKGSMKVTGVTVAGAQGTVSFDYRMTSDTTAKSSHLAMVVEGGSWKVCE